MQGEWVTPENRLFLRVCVRVTYEAAQLQGRGEKVEYTQNKPPMTKQEEFCIYAALLTGDWQQAYIAAHPKMKKDMKADCLYTSISRWRNRADVQDLIRQFGYKEARSKEYGRLTYIFDIEAQLEAISQGREFPQREYEISQIAWERTNIDTTLSRFDSFSDMLKQFVKLFC